MPNFNNTGQYNLGNNAASESMLAPFEGTGVFWVSRTPLTGRNFDGRAMFNFHHRLCSVRELSVFTGEVSNERESREAGKTTLTVNDGVTFGATLTIKGADIPTLAALQGKALHNTTAATINQVAGIRYGETFDDQGDLIIVDFTQGGAEGNVLGGRVIPNVTVKFEEVPGITDPETNVNVTLESTTNPYHFTNGIIPVPFLFWDNGTVTNALAPDGAITTFKIKDANEAYGAATTPTDDHRLQIVDGDQTGSGRYVINLRINGTITTTATVAPATAMITPSSTPADGAYITGICAMETGFPDGVEGENYSLGVVRKWGAGTYVANTDTTDSPTTTPADWDEVDMPTIPYWGTDLGGTNMFTATHPCHPGWSWKLFNFFG